MKVIKLAACFAVFSQLMLMSTVVDAKNGFLVAPGRVQINVEELKTHTFIITNTGDERIRLSIDPIYLDIDDPTMKAGSHIRPGVATEENIVENVRVSPRRLSLKPGQRRDIRVQITPLSDPRPGDYRAHLLVKMDETAYTSKVESEGKNNMNMQLNVKMETAVALYGRKDEPEVDVRLTCTKLEDGASEVAFTNASKWRFEGLLLSNKTEPVPIVLLRESLRTVAYMLPEGTGNTEFTLNNLDGEIVSKVICSEK